MRHALRYQVCIALVPILLSAPAGAASRLKPGATATLAVLETSDLHSNVVGYDYFKLAEDPSMGLDRAATLIRLARQEFANTVLLDNGDTIQGTALADYQALAKPVRCDQVLGIYKAMNKLGYDGAGVGNHEFNYGLAFLGQVAGARFDGKGRFKASRCAGPAFPMVLANVYSHANKKPLFAPYRIIDKRIKAFDASGKPINATVKVGIIGFTPPTILSWDKRWLEGKVYTEGVRETAQKYIPEMRAKGAELVVAISHSGIGGPDYSPTMENAGYHLAQVPGVDAMLLGHSHQAFPDARSRSPQFDLPGIDKARGTVFGVPTVMASFWGKNLGVIRLQLRHDGKRWVVEKDKTRVELRGTQQADKSYVAPDPAVMEAVAHEHAATIEYVKTPIGETDFRMSTYFAEVGDVTAIQVVNDAQTDYVKRYIAANLPQYANLPVLSMASPFKSGHASPADYTDVPAGKLALNNAADLYLYPNTLAAVKIDGALLKAWLEKAAGRFNTIDPAVTEPQELMNSTFPSFNLDMLTSREVRYEIDVTQPAGQRIRGLSYQGKPVGDAQEFIVATNSYRASGGGGFPGLDGSRTVIAAPDTNRDVLINYIRSVKKLSREGSGSARSWSFTKVKTAGPVVFRGAPAVRSMVGEGGLANVSLLREEDGQGKGYAVYAIDLAK